MLARDDQSPDKLVLEHEEGAEMDYQVIDYTAEPVTSIETFDDKTVEVYCWRLEQLLRAGYTNVLADILAEDATIDLHHACNLLAQGCDQRTACRILF